MYKVFFKDRVIFLCNDLAEVSGMQYDYIGAYGSDKDLKAQLDTFFGTDNDKNLFIYHNDLDELYKGFQSYFRFIPAAGGLVRNEKGENLIIYRRGKWDLPKGKADKGENPERTALRGDHYAGRIEPGNASAGEQSITRYDYMRARSGYIPHSGTRRCKGCVDLLQGYVLFGRSG